MDEVTRLPTEESGEPRAPAYQDVVRLREGERVEVDGGELTLELAEIKDSRCPADVICVWQGFVAVAVRASVCGGELQRVSLSSLDKCPAEIGGGFLLRLVDVVPYPGAGSPDERPFALVMVMRM